MITLQKYNNYYLTRKIATGGMAEIFRAWKLGEAGFEKQVVVKRMLTHLTSNEDFLAMFLSEAKLVSRLNHANITQVYDLGKNQDTPDGTPTYFIAMEFVFGRNLAQVSKRCRERNQSLSWDCIASICLGAAQALEYAHELCDEHGAPLRIVHRDISPQNILISYSGEVKLLDFGIAKALVERQQTQTGMLKGKLSYMSPEQALGEPVDQRSDIYSLGIVLWELLTGHRLFTGDSEVGILQKVIKPEVADPLTFNPDIPPALAEICMYCLRSDPEQRCSNALEMAKALNAYLHASSEAAHLAVRSTMHELFSREMLSEKEQIQEELLAVRHALAKPEGDESDATVIIHSDGTLGIGTEDEATILTDSSDPAFSPQKASMTLSGKVMRLANSMRSATRSAAGLTLAAATLLIVLIGVVALWPERTDHGVQHATEGQAAPATPIPAPPTATSGEVASLSTSGLPEPSLTPARHASPEAGPTPESAATSTSPSISPASSHTTPPEAEHTTRTQAPPEATTTGKTSAESVALPAPPEPSQTEQPRQSKPKNTSPPRDPSAYNHLADPSLQTAPRQFDQERFDRLQAEFQQGQFAALDERQTSGALPGKRITRSDAPPRAKSGQADVVIRIWRQFGASLEVSLLLNDQPASDAKTFTIGRNPVDIPIRLQSGTNVVRLTHAGSSIIDGIQVQVGDGKALSLSVGSRDQDHVIVEY
ncbi:serine/threonine-protein kinase [Desulfonatronum thiodismutans]|uniref:serine/threonine-protein kinase n=1 Tax=Desulfonatronum thiodismutans TaxID=159290 RepID=UPI00068B3E39|nr:serine/threonine-protein kinase [Desulfonatronum thiodismutans]